VTVDRNDLAGAHQDNVPHIYLIDRHVFERVSVLAVRQTRRAIDERPQISFCATHCKIFQRLAAGIHDGDDRPRQCLVKHKSSRHR
jgi:hypothetical protein